MIAPGDPSSVGAVDALARQVGGNPRYGQCWVFSSLTTTLGRTASNSVRDVFFGDADPTLQGFQPFLIEQAGPPGVQRITATIHFVDDFQGETGYMRVPLAIHLPGSPDVWQSAQVFSATSVPGAQLRLDWRVDPDPTSSPFPWNLGLPFIGWTVSVPEPASMSLLACTGLLMRRGRHRGT